MSKRLLAWLTTLLLLLTAAVPAFAETGAAAPAAMQPEEQLQMILQFQLSRSGAGSLQAWIDGTLAAEAGAGGEWYALALHQLRATGLPMDLTAYRQSLTAFLAAGGTYGSATRQKYALCMLASGGEAGELAADTAGQQGIMSWVYGLHLLNNGYSTGSITPEEAAARLVSLQLEDGGWAVMGQTADVDVTAMTLQALAPHRDDPAVAAAVERALELLSARQQEDGGFISMGQPNPESGAQVLIALCALGIDPLTDGRFIKNGCTVPDGMAAYQLEDGSYSHTAGSGYSSSATVQVFTAMTAWLRYQQGLPGLYQLDDQPDAGNQTNENVTAVTEPISDGAFSVGIIGGADGPTAVFVTSPGGWKGIAAVVIIIGAVLCCLWLLIRRKRSLKSWLTLLLITGLLLGLVFSLDIQTPESYYGLSGDAVEEAAGQVTLEIRCDSLIPYAHSDSLIPADGVILPPTAFAFAEGDTVFDVLTRAARQHRLQLDASGGEGMRYVAGLNHLYEQAYGELSGWMFFVNGQSASRSSDQYRLQDGDVISWQYTCEMGNDLK